MTGTATRPETEPVRTTVGAALTVRLLGELELRLGDSPLPPLESARAESLLAYRSRGSGSRSCCGPTRASSRRARTSAHVLHKLRRALPDADRYLDVGPRTLGWRPDAPLRLDLAAFEDALDRAAGAADPVEDLEAAVAAYAGDLLQGSYDEWLLGERERLRDRHHDALDRLARLLAERGDAARAIVHTERLLRLDPVREGACRLLMRLHDARGERARALRVYHVCAAALERDLGVEPSEETRRAHEALLPGAAEAEPARAVFVGRAAERARLTALWRESERGHAQLVLVTGEPGIGKTRLVEELRAWCAHRGAATAEARSYPVEGALAYGQVATWLRAEPLAARRHRLDPGRLAELARVLPELDATPRPLPESEQRQRLFDALAEAIRATSRRSAPWRWRATATPAARTG